MVVRADTGIIFTDKIDFEKKTIFEIFEKSLLKKKIFRVQQKFPDFSTILPQEILIMSKYWHNYAEQKTLYQTMPCD